VTHRLGFGCAGLYGLPDWRARRQLLECAYGLGIRHFDVAPMYGLGRAERELAEFARDRTDIEIATKFGIGLTPIGRAAGIVQAPIRRILRSSHKIKSKVKDSGQGHSGHVGRILYSSPDYSVERAKQSLESSLRTLGAAKIDYFFLHEPAAAVIGDQARLADYLDTERTKGSVGSWGLAGDLSNLDSYADVLSMRASALQFPYDLITGSSGPAPRTGRHEITFGILGGVLSCIQEALAREDNFRRECSELLGADLSDERAVVNLLVRDAVTQNASGTVLVSSTNVENLEMTCAAANTPLANETRVAQMIRNKVTGTGA
jgi:D-threo-aldose 1-dehydrogenase